MRRRRRRRHINVFTVYYTVYIIHRLATVYLHAIVYRCSEAFFFPFITRRRRVFAYQIQCVAYESERVICWAFASAHVMTISCLDIIIWFDLYRRGNRWTQITSMWTRVRKIPIILVRYGGVLQTKKKTDQIKTDDTTSDNIIVVKSERDNPEMRRKYIGSVAYAELVNGGG